jgi:hypothetical protein
MKEEYGITMNIAEGFSPARQTQESKEIMRDVLEGMSIWELAGACYTDSPTMY